MKNIIYALIVLTLMACGNSTFENRERSTFENQLENSGKYISTTDSSRSIEFKNTTVTYKSICTFSYGSWLASDISSVAPGYFAMTYLSGYIFIPGWSDKPARYCDSKDPNCITNPYEQICTNDKIYPMFSVAGNCITGKDINGNTEQFCK